jgi:hypothetical protein
MIIVHVPDHWTGEQALLICSFLEDIAHAIWDRHGAQMAHVLYMLHGGEDGAPTTPPADDPPPLGLHPTDPGDATAYSDDDIPF